MTGRHRTDPPHGMDRHNLAIRLVSLRASPALAAATPRDAVVVILF
ncbi:MAG TPA: hypothetical protein VHX11_09810 [Acidobacteriaceae bacterium]|nr:hypothetical protein [Acidobacteriaceae bacterium]